MNDLSTSSNPSFSTLMLTLQIAWDSTSDSALKKCARFYEYLIVRGYASPYESAHLTFGTLFHSATELYDRERASGAGHNEALLSAVRYAIINTWNFETKRPWTSSEPTKTRETLIRTIILYLDKFQDDKLQTIILQNGKPAVELSFRIDLDVTAPTGETYKLCGHIDRAVVWQGKKWIADKKSTKYQLDDTYFKQYTPNNQVSIYSIAGFALLGEEIDGLIIDGCQVLANGSRFRRHMAQRSKEQLEEWLRDFTFWLRQAELYATANYWPQNDKACGYGKNQCIYRQVCSADPSMRQELLDSLYVRRTWNPLEPR